MKPRNRQPASVDRGTPETLRHQKRRGPSTMEVLIKNKRISGYELRVADEIERCYVYATLIVAAKGMRYAPREDKAYSDRDPWWYRDAYMTRYKPFAAQFPESFSLIRSILIDGYSVRQLTGGNTTAVREKTTAFVNALRNYAINAGWVDSGTLDDWRREQG